MFSGRFVVPIRARGDIRRRRRNFTEQVGIWPQNVRGGTMKRTVRVLLIAIVIGGVLASLAAAASSPDVTTDAATKIGQSSAQLNAVVNPNGSKTSYQFQYGLTTAYGSSTPLKSAGGGTKGVGVKGSASQLTPGTPYHFRILAVNAHGTTVGSDRTFTTTGHPPAVATTTPATQIGKTSATLTGTINPNGVPTTYAFEYGPTPAYGKELGGGTLPASTTPQAVSAVLGDIAPGTLYHYRLIASHGGGVFNSVGADQAFYTHPSPAPKPKIRRFTSPLTDKRRPYFFKTHGSLTARSSIPQSVRCVGRVQIRYFLGVRQVSGKFAPLSSTCAYTSSVKFNHLQGSRKARRAGFQKLRVVVHFGGNGYLAAANSSTRMVTLG
jgi:hypothetical protein